MAPCRTFWCLLLAGAYSAALLQTGAAFSTFAGSCKHAGVQHGLDRFAAQEGAGGHTLSLSHPGVNVPGATVTVTLSGESDYKGLLLFAEVDGRLAGAWGDDLPEGVQSHPHCKQTVTHDTYHVGGSTRDAIPWIVPDDLAEGAEVVFKATVVRDYATWFAFEHVFVVGSEDGAGGAPELVKSEAAHVEEEKEEEEVAQAEETDAPADGDTAAGSPKLDMVAFRARQRRLRLLHAALMGVSWLVAAPAGAIVARYFKHLGAFWFDAHRLLQGVTVAASLFGGAIGLGILHPYLSNLGLHGKLGILVLLLTCAQPVNAYFRPAKTAGQPRASWKRLHAGLGWATVAGGAFNCFVGVGELAEKEGDSASRWYMALVLLALSPLVGASYLAQTRRRSVLPFSFSPLSAKSRDH